MLSQYFYAIEIKPIISTAPPAGNRIYFKDVGRDWTMMGHFRKGDHKQDRKARAMRWRDLTRSVLTETLCPPFSFARQGMAGVPFGKEAIGCLAIAPLCVLKLFANGDFRVAGWSHDTAGARRRFIRLLAWGSRSRCGASGQAQAPRYQNDTSNRMTHRKIPRQASAALPDFHVALNERPYSRNAVSLRRVMGVKM